MKEALQAGVPLGGGGPRRIDPYVKISGLLNTVRA
jgi:hypothetical protein